MPFEKGNRANPGGRPKKTEGQIKFERKCREWAELFALDNLKRAAKSEKPLEIIAAVKEICDRGFGKSEAITYLEANVTEASGSSIKDLEREFAEIIGNPEAEGVGSVSKTEVDAGK